MGDLHPLLPEDPERIGVHLLVGRLVEDPTQAVYLGHLPDEDTIRVIRVLEAHPGADPETCERITNELHAARRVSGAHTARLLEVGWFDDSPYVVREHVEGRSLREAVSADGPLSGDALERLAVSTLTALTAVHLSGLVHGGLSPDTVLLGPDGPRVCDIGLGDSGSEPGYRAPEHIQPALLSGTGQAPVPATAAGRPADLFSWAATVCYAATGRPPRLDRPETEQAGTAAESPVNLTGIPSGLRSLIALCLDSRPEARPDTRAAMLRLLGEQPTEALLPAPATPAEGGPSVPGANTGPQDGALYPASVLPPAAPLWSTPPLPGSPPPLSGAVITEPAREQRRSTGLPLMLVAGVGVVALMSGLGIWAAGSYASLGNVEQAAANEKAPLALASQWRGQSGTDPAQGGGDPLQGGAGPGQGGGDPSQGAADDPANRVTVPWGVTPEPRVGDVGPLQLSTDAPTPPTLNPLTSPPAAVPTIPTATPPITAPPPPPQPQPTEQAKETRKARPTEQAKETQPTPRATEPRRTSQPRPSQTQQAPQSPAPTQAEPSRTQEAPQSPAPTQSRPASSKPTTNPPVVNPEPPPAAKPTTKPPASSAAAKPAATSKPAAAAQRSNPYTPTQVCGSGYYVQRSVQFGGGTTYQLYNTSSGTNCAVTMKTADVGKATQVWVTLEAQGGGAKTERGNFEYYAGPVYVPAKGKCVRISGGGPGGSTSAGWANCG
ncbi:serine/threonine protein kinase [Streptosporangium sp. NPDC049644]|uniref:protein kinase domain-containing protein n=1 Tax=Streptosporangium sp. NPDC049644 TaxID=3155507 RepID=UPI00343BD802